MKIINKLAAPFKIIKVFAHYEPLYLVFSFPQIVLTAMLPLLYVYFPKLFIEQMTSGKAYIDIAKKILSYAIILLVINLAKSIMENQSGFYADRFSKKLKEATGHLTMGLPLEQMEGAGFQDFLAMANNISDLTNTMGTLQNILSGIITVAGLAVIITRLDIIFILLVTATLSFKMVFVYCTYKHKEKRRILYATNGRTGNYLTNIAYFNEGGAKEIRLNNLQSWFMDKVKSYRDEMLALQYTDFKQYALFESITAVIMALQSFVILWLLSARFMNGMITIADFTMYFSAVTALTTNLSSITEQIGEYNNQQLCLSDFHRLSELNVKKGVLHPAIPENSDIIFENVSFAYPNTGRKILNDISIKIKNNEKLAVVGLNGAGKSTFIKLLCKFYRPTSGKITIGGVDIWDIPNEEYVRLISAVFQDFTNFSFSIGENVSMGDNFDSGKVTDILNGVGLGTHIAELPHGIHTCLSKNFAPDGVELSGGEGQKLAIARAVYKDTPVLILDEPTASLDPKAESEIYQSCFAAAKNKTTIFISHRLAASTLSDHIAVFSGGRIAEYGSHDELIRKDGLYAEMFRKQSKGYKDTVLQNF